MRARFARPYFVVSHSKRYKNIFMKLNINLKWRKPEMLSDLMSVTFCLVIHQPNRSGGESKYGWFSYHLIIVMRAPLAYCNAVTTSIHFGLTQSSSDLQSMDQHDEADDESLLCHMWVRCERPTLQLWFSLWLWPWLKSSLPLRGFKSLFIPGSWITIRHSCLRSLTTRKW